MHKILFRACVIALGIATVAGLTAAVDPLDVAQFKKLHGELTSAKEPWQGIPWHLSILDARAEAARDKKPVYMLVRSGHPLGCV